MRSPAILRSIAAACLASLAACSGSPHGPQSDGAAATGGNAATPSKAASLDIRELRPGAGAPIAAGQTAVVQYTGWLYESAAADGKGRQFDSSLNSGQPFRFVVGAGQVIKGWDQGVLGMTAGSQRRLTIPADLAYGDRGAGGVIPPGATLIFDVALVGIE